MSQSGSCILVLDEPEGGRRVPIIVGRAEAQSILLALHPDQSSKMRRPTTHQLMASLMSTHGISLRRVTIDRVVEGVFFATLHLSDGFTERSLDSRTTDAVTLAVICGAPILMDERVLEETGVKVDGGSTKAEEPTLEELELELRRCEDAEEYERAAEIQQQIEKLTKRERS